MGCRYIGLGMMPERYRTKEWLSHFMDDFKEPAKKIAASGKLLMYTITILSLRHLRQKICQMQIRKKRMIEYLMEGFAPDEMGNYSGHLLGSGSRS